MPNGCYGGFCRPRGLLEDSDEAVAIREGQWPQQNGIDGGEDRGVGADAKRQRQHDRQCEAGSVSERAHGVTDVPHRGIHPAGDIDVTSSLALDDWVAELNSRPPSASSATDALRMQLVGALGDVERDLALDVAFEPVQDGPRCETSKPGHALLFLNSTPNFQPSALEVLGVPWMIDSLIRRNEGPVRHLR